MACARPSCSRARIGALAVTLALVAGCDGGTLEGRARGSAAPAPAPAPVPAGLADLPRAGQFGAHRWALSFDQAGTPLPATVLTDPEGAEARLAVGDGRGLLVNLWASWCAPCIAEMPTLAALAKDGQARVAAVALDARREDAQRFMARAGLDDGFIWHDATGDLLTQAGAGLPTTVFYGPDGRERWRVVGGFDWTGPIARTLLAAP